MTYLYQNVTLKKILFLSCNCCKMMVLKMGEKYEYKNKR